MTELVLTTGPPAAGGGVVARDAGGRVTFVRHALPGERVRAVVTEEHPTWARADAVEVLDASPDRVVAPCPHARPGGCGGCDYQHVALGAQRRLKLQRVQSQLAGVLDDVGVAEVEAASGVITGLATRTRVRYGVTNDGHLAMRRHASHVLVPVEHCPLGVARLVATERDREWPSRAEVELISLGPLVPPTVVVTLGGRRRRPTRSAGALGTGLSERQVVDVLGHRFEVSAGSFFQVHEAAPVVLTDAVLAGLGLEGGERVAELYCGVGLFTSAIAERVGPTGRVFGVDGAASAVADALVNLASSPWATVEMAPIGPDTVAQAVLSCTHVVVDPPRVGIGAPVLAELSRTASLRRLVYVSCEPSTLARDLATLRSHGWRVSELRCFDLFEMTEHVECVVTLER